MKHARKVKFEGRIWKYHVPKEGGDGKTIRIYAPNGISKEIALPFSVATGANVKKLISQNRGLFVEDD